MFALLAQGGPVVFAPKSVGRIKMLESVGVLSSVLRGLSRVEASGNAPGKIFSAGIEGDVCSS